MSVRAPDICDADELAARAAAMRDTLRERQAECEALGRLPDETNRDYVEAGFFRVLQPRRFAGFELGLQAFLRVAVELSRGCPSSGWVYALTAGHAHTVTMWPEQGQVELFGDGEFRCPLSNLPAKAVRVEGGYRLDGWWDYGSGCDTATHFIGGVAVEGEPGHTRWAAFPRGAGTSATRKGEAVERCFRDVNMIRTHVTMQFDRTFENVGQMRLGLAPAGFF